MGVRINKEKNIVEWIHRDKVINIYNEHIVYAFPHGNDLLMIKELYENSNAGFSAYDSDGTLVFSYCYLSNSMRFGTGIIEGIDGVIISVDYDETKKVLAILVEKDNQDRLLLYNSLGFLAEINPPRGYFFVSLMRNQDGLMVVARGLTDMTSDAYGRNDWAFSINMDGFFVEKQHIVP